MFTPRRAAIAWATWDLIAMVEKGIHDGPPTHAITFIWNGQEVTKILLCFTACSTFEKPIRSLLSRSDFTLLLILVRNSFISTETPSPFL